MKNGDASVGNSGNKIKERSKGEGSDISDKKGKRKCCRADSKAERKGGVKV